jgi:hypothetical protein
LFEDKPASASDVQHHAEDEKEDEGTDQFKIGPVAGVGIPSIISFGGTLKLTRFLGAGINIGLIPKVQLDYYGKATLSYQHYDIYGRLYPFGGGFFLGAGAGYATVDGTLASSYKSPVAVPAGFPDTANYDGKGSVRTLMLTALIGYFYTTSIGFSFGVDAGVQLPIAPSKITFASGVTPKGLETAFAKEKKQADDSVRSSLEKIGRTPLPTLNLRIGWIL